MPVTLTNALPSIAFSRNPILIELTSDDYLSSDGTNAVFNIVIKSAITAGQQIHISWPNAAPLIFTAATTPDGSGLQFPTGDGSTGYVASLVPVFKANYYVDRDFTITTAMSGLYPCLQLGSRIPGVIYNVNEADETHITVDQVIVGTNRELLPGFSHHLEVWMLRSGTPSKIYDNNLQLDYPITGVTTKDISEILNPYLSPPNYSDRPAVDAITWQACNNTIAQYFIKYAQYYGDSPTVKKVSATDPVWVSSGGLAINAALGQTLISYIRPGDVDQDVLCLRQGSKVKAIQKNQPEWLYWLNLTGDSINIKVLIDIYYTDGTKSKFTYAPFLASAWQKYYIAAGCDQIDIPGHSTVGKTCSYYTARVVKSDGTYLSSLYTYILDTYKEFPRYFIYQNSFGGYQTLYTWGKCQFETDRTKDDLVKQVTQTQAAVSGQQQEANIRLQDKCTVNTGYKTAREIALLRDFLASGEKYWFYNGALIPIGIGSDNLKQPMDGDNLPAAQFVFYPLYSEFAFTDDMNQPDDMNNADNGNLSVLVDKDGNYIVTTPDGNQILI